MTNENINATDVNVANNTDENNIKLHSNVNIDFKPKKRFNPKPFKNRNSNETKEFSINSKAGKIKFDAKWEIPVKIWSLLWLEQVGQCIFLEYGDDIIIMDCGLEFSAIETMWADYIIPDITYLKKNIKKIKWVVLTHGHLDHIWALKHILPELNWPMVYTTPLTLGLVKKTLEEYKTVNKLKYKIVDPDTELVKLWCFTIEFVRVNHNIPETFALAIQTPKWLIFNSADFKIDHTPAIDKPADLHKIARLWQEWIKLYIWDSLGCDKPWVSKSEKIIWNNLEDIIKKTDWRLIIWVFATNVWRIIQIIHSAVKYGKMVYYSGRSMVNNIEVCKELWYINVPSKYLRKMDRTLDEVKNENCVVIATGAQWEEMSVLDRLSRDDHPQIKLQKTDTILVSATAIPGNETQVSRMLSKLVLKWVNLITNNDMDIHASWHGYEEDHKLMLSLLKPDYFMPFYTEPLARYAHRKIWLNLWMLDEKILMPEWNGAIIEMYDNLVRIWDYRLKLDTILVDGKWIWWLEWEYVTKARKIMSESWLLNIIFKIDAETRELVGNIQIESRWFVYTTEIRKIHTEVVKFVEAKYNELKKLRLDIKSILKQIKADLELYLDRMISRTPMIVPMFVYINKDGKEVKVDTIWSNDLYHQSNIEKLQSHQEISNTDDPEILEEITDLDE